MNYTASISLLIIQLFGFYTAFSQQINQQELQADRLHKDYKFNEALSLYNELLLQTKDSLRKIEIEKKIIHSENGKALLDFASAPVIIAQNESNIDNFFLTYPCFEDKSWIKINPNFAKTATLPNSTEFANVIYYPSNSKKIIFSSPDNSGSWNLYSISKINDTLWSAPSILNEYITSVGNEVLPVLSQDGNTLYFSSNGHYGMGGYDLYVSTWDDSIKDWGVPQNMGFPYSSTGNDFLYYNTTDGLYSLFSSDRDSDSGEITTYAAKYEANPLKRSISEDEAKVIARLQLAQKEVKENKGEQLEENSELSRYTTAVKEVRKLQQSIREAQTKINANREKYNTLNEEEQANMLTTISNQENLLLSLQQDLNFAQNSLQKIEMDFLSKGIIIDREVEEPKNEPKNESIIFKFANNSIGDAPKFTIMDPEPEIDLSFKIQKEAMIADLSEFPTDGLIYQIQLFVISNKASLKSLKGLSPVFERKTPTGKYLYTAGIFHTYNEALNNLNKVKKQGFPNAIITAYNNGKSTSIANARALEKKIKETTLLQVVIEGVTSLSPETLQVIRETSDKDIARVVEDGITKFIIAPFNSKSEADKLKAAIESTGINGITIENMSK